MYNQFFTIKPRISKKKGGSKVVYLIQIWNTSAVKTSRIASWINPYGIWNGLSDRSKERDILINFFLVFPCIGLRVFFFVSVATIYGLVINLATSVTFIFKYFTWSFLPHRSLYRWSFFWLAFFFEQTWRGRHLGFVVS